MVSSYLKEKVYFIWPWPEVIYELKDFSKGKKCGSVVTGIVCRFDKQVLGRESGFVCVCLSNTGWLSDRMFEVPKDRKSVV